MERRDDVPLISSHKRRSVFTSSFLYFKKLFDALVAKNEKKGEIKMSEEITKDTETTDEVVKTVPYERFKLVNEERNTYKTSVAEKDNQIKTRGTTTQSLRVAS